MKSLFLLIYLTTVIGAGVFAPIFGSDLCDRYARALPDACQTTKGESFKCVSSYKHEASCPGTRCGEDGPTGADILTTENFEKTIFYKCESRSAKPEPHCRISSADEVTCGFKKPEKCRRSDCSEYLVQGATAHKKTWHYTTCPSDELESYLKEHLLRFNELRKSDLMDDFIQQIERAEVGGDSNQNACDSDDVDASEGNGLDLRLE